jgi:hypothetical protein
LSMEISLGGIGLCTSGMKRIMRRKLCEEQGSDKSLLNFTKRDSDLEFMALERLERTGVA